MPQVAAQLWTTGPAHLYIGPTDPNTPLTSAAYYLGTCEYAPHIEILAEYTPVFNDLGGSKIPFDTLYEGEMAHTFAEVNRFSETTLAFAQNRPNHFTSGVRGTNVGGDVGSLILTEKKNISVYVVFPYASKAAYAGSPAGYRFPFSVLRSPDKMFPLGTKPRKVAMIFEHLRGFYPATGVFGLYDHVVAGLPTPL